MRNYLTPAKVFAVFCLFVSLFGKASVTTTYHPVYFETDSFSLSAEAQQQLSELVKQRPTNGEVEIFISGHTDAEGNSGYNQKLSENRAESVAKQFAMLGVPPENIHNSYYGESRPVSANSSETGKAKNRRVEIAVKHTVVNSINDITGVDSTLAPQQFQINIAMQQTVTGRKGIEITIPADAFTDASGKDIKSGNVTVTLTEFTGIADAFFHGVTTMSDKGVLESGGMYNLTASLDGSPLQLKRGKELAVKIPAFNPVQDMKVYLSKTDSAGKLLWVESAAAFVPTTRPVDTQTIQLSKDKYQAFLRVPVSMPDAGNIPFIRAFALKEPPRPVRPRLSLQTERDLKNSGVRHILKNKKVQQKMLERINHNIQVNNEKRLARYDRQMALYLADSASYPERMRAYSLAKMDYMDYFLVMKHHVDSLSEEYRQAVVSKRLQYYLAKMIEASENGKLYRSNLVQRVRNFCMSENNLLRDLSYERRLEEVVNNAQRQKVCWGNYFFMNGFYARDAFRQVAEKPEVKEAMAALVDDNPYLSAKEKEFQKEGLTKGLVVADYTQIQQASYYSATVGQLGYVNCDRLYSEDNVVAMKVENLNSMAESVAFIKGANVSQHIYGEGNRFKKDEDLRLLSVYFENGRPLVAYRDVKMNNSQKVELEYKPMKTEEFKQLVLSFI